MIVAHETGGGQGAAFSGGDAVENDFAPAFGDLLHSDRACEQKEEIRRKLPGAENARSFGQVYDPAFRQQTLTHFRGQLLEGRETVDPGTGLLFIFHVYSPSSCYAALTLRFSRGKGRGQI